jgi:hypothetical protein
VVTTVCSSMLTAALCCLTLALVPGRLFLLLHYCRPWLP